ncbi:GtrA family protein [Actinopolymorpha singaporensis]|uniref:GtrA family protein n=1 Tax=Actinopolymorpha singaporensis TaxID=117157 RepID=UPI000B823A23|nr:GtrA family protein [Actinopolymorpha singaporensis]
MKPLDALQYRVRRLAEELAKFGAVGAVAFVVDLGGFNLLRYGLDHHGPLEHKPLTARTISVVLATLVAYFGNRHWTWKDRPRRAVHHEYALFFLLNFAALVVNLAILGVANYVLGLHDPLSNLVANLVGIGLGTLMRFWSYRRFVFRAPVGVNADGEPDPRLSSPV